VGELSHAGGADFVVDAMAHLLSRHPSFRFVFVGDGPERGSLEARAHREGVAHAVRFLGHQELPALVPLVRACEAVVLPSRGRVSGDESAVDLARRGKKAVIATHGGVGHRVRHEEDGIVTYDNPGSIVWALDRALGDPAHAEAMGRRGARGAEGEGSRSWESVASRVLRRCVETFPALRA
jgi:glycosyltransferase involved in cell wall biosynthesis